MQTVETPIPAAPASKRPTSTNLDIVNTLAKYVYPDPVTFVQLAMVNRDFYTVFTSDKVWNQLNVYKKTENIFQDFMERLPGYDKLLKYCWTSLDSRNRFQADLVDNRYVQLGSYIHHRPVHLCLTHEDAHPASQWLLELLPNFGHSELRDRCHEDLGNTQYLIDVISKRPSEFSALPQEYKHDGDFCIQLIEATKHSKPYFLAFNQPQKVYEHAIVVNPDAIVLNIYLFSILRPLARRYRQGRQSVLEFVTSRPYFLDMFPEYWGDHEICMAALEYYPGIFSSSFYFSTDFLKECKDNQVITAALQMYPQAILNVPTRYQSRAAWQHSIKLAIQESACHISEAIKEKSELCNDSEIFAACLESEMFTSHFDPELQNKYLSDLEWMKQRVSGRVACWYDASVALRQNKEFFMHSVAESLIQEPISIGFMLQFYNSPDSFFEDPEMKEAIRKVPGWYKFVPKKDKFLDLRLEGYREVEWSIEEDKESYNFLRAAIKQDVFRIRDCPKTVYELAKDPELEEFILENIYVVDWVCGRFLLPGHFTHFPFSDLVLRYSQSNPEFRVINLRVDGKDCYRPDWTQIDKDSILRIFMRYPVSLMAAKPDIIYKELIIEALEQDGRLFGYLDQEFQNDLMVQRAIGPPNTRIQYDYKSGFVQSMEYIYIYLLRSK